MPQNQHNRDSMIATLLALFQSFANFEFLNTLETLDRNETA